MGRLITGVVVLVSILWIPMIRYLSGEVYQYLQSVQAYIGAPITATFVLGILWKGGTSRAAISTLVVGGLAGAGRFALDILYKAYGVDLGPLNGVGADPVLELQRWRFLRVLGAVLVRQQAGGEAARRAHRRADV